MLGLSYAIRLSPRIEKRLATLFTPSPSRVGHPGDPYKRVRVQLTELDLDEGNGAAAVTVRSTAAMWRSFAVRVTPAPSGL